MKHEEIKRKIGAFMDDEVKDAEKSEITAHLEACAECRGELEALAANNAILSKATGLNPSANFRVGMNAKLDKAAAGRHVFDLTKLIPIPIALSLIVLIASAFFMAAPYIYASNDNEMKTRANEMAGKALAACMTGSIFAPAAFAKFYEACSVNMCECCGDKCGDNCKMGGKKHGN
jgi:hypothetical protein